MAIEFVTNPHKTVPDRHKAALATLKFQSDTVEMGAAGSLGNLLVSRRRPEQPRYRVMALPEQ